MADFVTVLNRAITATGASTPEERKALYDKAKAALIRQLESRDPPLTPLQLADQTAALDRAVAEIEAELSPPEPEYDPFAGMADDIVSDDHADTTDDSATGDTDEDKPVEADHAEDVLPEPVEQPSTVIAEQAPASEAPPSAGLPPRPVPPPRTNPIKMPPPDEPAGPVSAASRGEHGAFRAAVSESARLGEATSHTGRDARQRMDTLSPASPEDENDEISSIVRQVEEADAARAAPGYGAPALPRDDGDGMPPYEEEQAPSRSRGWLWLVLILVIVGGAAGAAWTQRDQLNDLVASFTGEPAPAPGETPVKSEERIGDAPADPPRNVAEQAAPAEQPAAAAPETSEPAASQAALIEENADDPNQAEVVDGTVAWSVREDGGAKVIDATVEFPGRDMTVALTMRKNTDTTLPASHVIEILFTLPEDFPSGGVSNVPGLLMKATPQAQGTPLAGESVRVTNGYFWIGLSNADVELRRNLSELKNRGFIDIPLVYDNGRRGILSIAKGPDGEAAFNEAFAAWGE